MRVLLGLLKVLTGISLAIAILFFSGMYAVRYAMTRLNTLPDRPVFPEETPEATAVADTGPQSDGTAQASDGAQDSINVSDAAAATGSDAGDAAAASAAQEPDSQVNSTQAEELEPGAYRARVVQPIGLVLRQGPDVSTIQLGGVAYDQELIVLSESSDGRWLNVRLPGSDVEGWVKNGNTEPTE